MSNTLFNYFTKPNSSSPKVQSNGTQKNKTPNSSIKKHRTSDIKTPKAKKAKLELGPAKAKQKENKTPNEPGEENEEMDEDSSIDEVEALLENDGSEDEYKPSKSDDNESSEDESGEESDSVSEKSESEEEANNKKSKKRKAQDTKEKSSSSKVTKKLESSFHTPTRPKLTSSTPATPFSPAGNEGSSASGDKVDNYAHLKFEFLKPDKLRDAKKRKTNDPEYDPRTLYIPDEFKKTLTPAHKQWWDMKATHFDCVLFFKVGKFYELFHMDAVIGVNELNLTYMKGDFAHSGFPEIAYGRFATTLVEKGFKVARVEQTETPDMMEKRCKTMGKVTKFDKVVKREICQITTKGTRVFSVIDGETKEPESHFLLAISEKKFDNGGSAFGVCFVDTSIGEFNLGQFTDDKQCSRLRTLVAHYPPSQIIYERGRISKGTQHLLNVTLSSVLKDGLLPDSEFWSSGKTLVHLADNNYFDDNSMPESLKHFLADDDSLGLTASDEGELAVRSLGAVTWYLKRCQLDHQLLSMKKFSVYTPVDCENDDKISSNSQSNARHMVLDAVTLKNLHILENSIGGIEGTLLHKLDNCSTPFGKRLLYNWICSPLNTIASVIGRQNAIQLLMDNSQLMQEVRPLLAKLPDLERLLSRIYAQSTFGLEASHPDNRAIMFEEKTYSKKKIVEFTNVLNGFQNVVKIAEIFQDSGVGMNSQLLGQCCHYPSHSQPGQFPDLKDHLEFFKNAFDIDEALKEGRIIPSAGVDAEYDGAVEELKVIEKELKQYLDKQCSYFGCKVTYVGADKKRFQLEVTDNASKRAGSEYELQGQRKGYKRYWTPKCKELLEKQIAAEDMKTSALQDLRRRIFARFSDRMNDWRLAVECISVLDVLLSLATYCSSQENDMCVPKFESVKQNQQAIVNVVGGRFPCSSGDEVFVPNDTVIGEDGANLVLVTGPNMGGKSTLMRQLGLIVIMAQMGCHVPAESVVLNPVDRIFTRLGANDDIMSGESTFFMELSETSAILQHATSNSLVLIDELGRGTSTYDGTAIAAAVLKELSKMNCRTLFSTHYHSLVEDFKNCKTVKLGHMSCMAETEDEEMDTGAEESVTFLYKFAEGACPKSYGFNAARLAGIPTHIIKTGHQFAKQLEFESTNRKLFKDLFKLNDPNHLRQILSEVH
ncbi:hypothetical protein LSTR_LSTR004669 [Laodelphax striatellus]|uniref:DNA mismatch repair protein n=1 Tax=Laodelphax striatellus TaxID=195883 RepID=A0A482WUZ6_LAOST|nr:hypothetical protein LSTR_LSTR004669 [Laodelphax striatellus]